MRYYKKKYKARFVNASSSSSIFRYSTCVLPVSVGQDYHQQEKLRAILDIIDRNFLSCTVIIADLLQRHTLPFLKKVTEDEAKKLSIVAGKEWYEAQKIYFSGMTIPFTVRFWDEWLYTQDYTKQRLLTEELYCTQPMIYEAFQQTVQNFFERNFRTNLYHFVDESEAKQKILEYVKEECSIMPLWVKDQFHFEAYPARRTPAMAAIYDFLIKPFYPHLLRWLRIELRSQLVLMDNPEITLID